MKLLCDEPRLRVCAGPRVDLLAAFGEDVRAGLTSAPKRLSCRYFYDAEGSRLFEEICELPEYYLTRTEASILSAMAGELADSFEKPPEMIELGSGSSAKTRILIDAMLARHGSLVYRPIDISADALVPSARALLEDHDGLVIRAFASEYVDALRALHAEPDGDARRLVLWLGSSIGNFDREGAAGFLASLVGTLDAHDCLLVGIDLRKEAAVLEAAYDDAAGVTAAFNLNLIERINRDLGGDLDVGGFRHVARYDVEEGRIEMYLEATRAMDASIRALDLDVSFEAGERIHTEDSYKYSLDEIDALARAAGVTVERRWFDSERLFTLVAFRASR